MPRPALGCRLAVALVAAMLALQVGGTGHSAESSPGGDWIRIPAGELRMGSEDLDDDCRPVHRVRIPAFEIARREVTHAEYGRFMAETGRAQPAHWKAPRFSPATHPVVGVSWDDAVAYCRWAGGRLPTEAEWEMAARGPEGRRYPWGEQDPAPALAVFHLDVGFGGTKPVGSASKGATPLGVEDLAGNVFEWCQDWYDPEYYRASPIENPTGPPSGRERVVRGGSWISLPDACRAAARSHYPSAGRSLLIGIRVVRDLPAGAEP